MKKIGKTVLNIAKKAAFVATILMSLELVYAAFLTVKDFKYNWWIPANAILTYEETVNQDGRTAYEHRFQYQTQDGSIMEAHSIDKKPVSRDGNYIVVYYNPEDSAQVMPDAFRRKFPEMMQDAVIEVISATVFVLIILFINYIIRQAADSLSKAGKKRGITA